MSAESTPSDASPPHAMPAPAEAKSRQSVVALVILIVMVGAGCFLGANFLAPLLSPWTKSKQSPLSGVPLEIILGGLIGLVLNLLGRGASQMLQSRAPSATTRS